MLEIEGNEEDKKQPKMQHASFELWKEMRATDAWNLKKTDENNEMSENNTLHFQNECK